jgi:DNA repair photolyase
MAKGNMYPDVETWNPLAGECPHQCSYCSTHSLMRYPVIKAKYSGQLRLDYKAFGRNLGKDRTWFVCAQNDLFAEAVPEHWIHEVFSHCKKFDNIYFFQTKNPDRYLRVINEFPPKSILCTTIETNRSYPCMAYSPSPAERAYAMSSILTMPIHVTIEPIMDFDLKEMVQLIKMCDPQKVNIGADSKGNHLPEPSKENLLELISELQKFTTIDRKTNLARLLR